MHSSNKQLLLSLSRQLAVVFHLQQQKQEFFPTCFKMAIGSRISEALTRIMLKNTNFSTYFGWFIFLWQYICSSNTVIHIIVIWEGAANYEATILISVKRISWYELKSLVIQQTDKVHFRVFTTCWVVFQTTNSESPRLLLVADTSCMLPQWNRANMKFLYIINGANSKLTFFCNCQTV